MSVVNTRLFFISFLLISSIILFQWMARDQSNQLNLQSSHQSIGNPDTLKTAYQNWKAKNYKISNTHILQMPLLQVKGLSTAYSKAQGVATLDLVSGEITITVSDFSQTESAEVWLRGSEQKNKVTVGKLAFNSNQVSSVFQLNTEQLLNFELSQVIITSGKGNDILFGSPTLFQRMFYDEVRLNKVATLQVGESVTSMPFSFLIPSPAFAADSATTNLSALVAEGERLFFNETFSGNGRTCGTCHRAENNFTIDPAFIATLPANDPLFVAEFNPALKDLEDPLLLRKFALIRANLDGVEDPANKFVLRSVSHMLGLSMSVQSSATEPPLQMTGWSGDGAPGGGTLRDFSTGAVFQHYTKSLARVEGVDFRLPTASELDALEAFMFSLGRQSDPDLNLLRLINPSAERGRVLFLAEDSQNNTVLAAKCNICHRNAGALTLADVNANFITGVENMPHPATLIGGVIPADGGFGTQLNSTTGGFGDGSFNTTSLWEAADTAPFFHHNAAATLEEAIDFYNSKAFRDSIEGQRLLLMDSGKQEMAVETDALAAFLRVINVIENIRSSQEYLQRASGHTGAGADKLLSMAISDITDILKVLAEGDLHIETVALFDDSKLLLGNALNALDVSQRDGLIVEALNKFALAKTFIVDSTSISDVEKPLVSILSPIANDTIAGLTTINVEATDNIAVSDVIVMAGLVEVGRSSVAPYSFTWDTTQFVDGAIKLTAIATDSSGNRALTSIFVNLENLLAPVNPVVDTVSPVVSIVRPSQNIRVAGSVLIIADATDNVSVDRVAFVVGQTALGVVNAPPYELSWDTTVFAEGLQQITVTAIDSSGNAAAVMQSVIVDNVLTEVCTVYSCATPPPPVTEPRPGQQMPIGSSPDGSFGGVLEAINVIASTITVSSGGVPVTVTITSETQFLGSIAAKIDDLLIGHVVQGEFFQSTNEIVWLEADMPPGF